MGQRELRNYVLNLKLSRQFSKLNIWDSPGSISLTILLKDLLDVASIDLPDSQSLE